MSSHKRSLCGVCNAQDCGEIAFRATVHHAMNTENTVKQFGHCIEINSSVVLGDLVLTVQTQSPQLNP